MRNKNVFWGSHPVCYQKTVETADKLASKCGTCGINITLINIINIGGTWPNRGFGSVNGMFFYQEQNGTIGTWTKILI